jgi:hypothetical protein
LNGVVRDIHFYQDSSEPKEGSFAYLAVLLVENEEATRKYNLS